MFDRQPISCRTAESCKSNKTANRVLFAYTGCYKQVNVSAAEIELETVHAIEIDNGGGNLSENSFTCAFLSQWMLCI